MNKILIVEDEISLSNALKDKLSQEGLEIIVAKDGNEGVNLAVQNHPDLILLDIMMPKMNGLDVLKALKNNPGLLSIPVFVLTNLPQENTGKIAKDLGAEEYLVKANLPLGELVKKIKARLSR